jgi:hypothetical protein
VNAKLRRSRFEFPAALLLAWLVIPSVRLAAQGNGPLTPAPPREVRKISGENHPEPLPIPADQIIHSMAVKEDEFLHAHPAYSFKRSIRFEEFPADGEAGGSIVLESDIFLAANGKRYERVTGRHITKLRTLQVEAEDLPVVARLPFFPLTSDQLRYYDLTYLGIQPLDELRTFIFQVKPKKLLRGARLFDGLVYVDDRDLAIVKIYGRWNTLLNEDEEDTNARDLPFSIYEIYYENVDGKYWFPNYIRSEGFLPSKTGDNRLRLTLKMTDFKMAPPAPPPDGARGGTEPPDRP